MKDLLDRIVEDIPLSKYHGENGRPERWEAVIKALDAISCGWISIEKELPVIGKRVDLVWYNGYIRKRLVGRMYVGGKWWTKSEEGEKYQIDLGEITHWKYQEPLP